MTRTILLADDSVTIQKVVELTFMDQDYRIVAVSDGSTAVARLSELKPDLLIADVHMPGADGYEVCRRSKATYPDVPVLLLVGTFEHFDGDAAAAAGAESHLKKPFDSQDLLHQVEALIARSGRPAAGAPPIDLEPPSLTDDEVTSVSAAAVELEPPADEPTASTPFPLGASQEAPPAEPVFDDAWGTITPSPPALEPEPPVAAEPFPEPTAEAIPEEPVPRTAVVPAFEAPTFEDPWGVQAVAPAAEPPVPPATEPAIEAFTVETPAFEESPAEPLVEEAPPVAAIPADALVEEAPSAEALLEAAPAEAVSEEPVSEEPAEVEAFAVEAPAVEPPAVEALYAEPATSAGEPIEEEAAEPTSEEPEPEPAATSEEPSSEEPQPVAAGANGLSDADVDRIARRVVEMAGDATLREVAWEVVPDLAEVIIKERIRELESQVE